MPYVRRLRSLSTSTTLDILYSLADNVVFDAIVERWIGLICHDLDQSGMTQINLEKLGVYWLRKSIEPFDYTLR